MNAKTVKLLKRTYRGESANFYRQARKLWLKTPWNKRHAMRLEARERIAAYAA